jgi:uncharacterized protein (TIGR02453 family)
MLNSATIHFLQQLALNNNRPWFEGHKEEYTSAKENFETLITGILAGLSETEPMFKEQKAKDCIFRIFRDVRFSKDKSPYKPNFGAFFSKGGRKFPGAGYYLHIEPGGKSFAGGGLWMPEAPLLKAIRQEIDYNFSEFTTLINEGNFKKLFPEVNGEKLKNLPSGYTGDNPAAEFLKLKSFTVSHPLNDANIAEKNLEKKTIEIFNSMRPFIDFLNKSLG